MTDERTEEELLKHCSGQAEWTEDEIFDYYQNCFKRIYADLVAVTANKPSQIFFETEAMLSHLGVAKTSTDPEIAKNNIRKAGGHLERASLDAAKILWVTYRTQLQPIIDDTHLRKYCTLLPEHEFLARYHEATSLALNARKIEIENVGISPRESVMHYYKAANAFYDLLKLVDGDAQESFKKFRLFHMIKTQILGFATGLVTGLISSAVIAFVAWRYLPPHVGATVAIKSAATQAIVHKSSP